MISDFRMQDAKTARGHSLETVNQFGECNFGRILHQQMHVVILAIAFNELCFKIFTNPFKELAQGFTGNLVQHFPAIFCDKDQMHMQCENAMPACTKIA